MRDIPTSPRVIEIKRKRRLRKLRIFILLLILSAAAVWGLSVFSYDKRITIDNIAVSGTHVISQEDIKEEVYKNISGKYIYLFSKANSFIYPRNKIYENLRLNFPRIESLSIRQDNFKTVSIDIIERTGSYLYCGSAIPANRADIGENCYFVNNDGFIFDKAPYFSGNVYFKYYMELPENVSNPLGKQMLDVGQFQKLARFIDGVEYLGFKPTYLTRSKEGINNLFLNHGTNASEPKIIFKNENDLDAILENFSIAMMKKEFADEINSKYNALLYIDLRFDNKVLYKFNE